MDGLESLVSSIIIFSDTITNTAILFLLSQRLLEILVVLIMWMQQISNQSISYFHNQIDLLLPHDKAYKLYQDHYYIYFSIKYYLKLCIARLN